MTPGNTASTSGDLLEREVEITRLDAALAAGARGSGRLVVVEGTAGVGRSALLGVVGERARGSGMLVLAGSGLELERGFPFGLALRLLGPTLADLDAGVRAAVLSGPAAVAAALLDGRVTPDGSAGDHGAPLVHALRWVVAHLVDTAGSGVVLVADDAHWSDEPSLRFLTYLAAEVAAVPVVVVVAARTGTPGAPHELLDRLRDRPGCQILRPAALSGTGVSAVVRRAYPDAAPDFIEACALASGGNPFYLRELIGATLADGIPATPGGALDVAHLVPEAVLRSVQLRLGALSRPARRAAAAAAVLGGPAPLRRIAAVAGLGARDAEEAADALAAAHILLAGGPVRFAHPMVAAAVRAGLPAHAKGRVHRTAAGVLAAEGAPPTAVATHLLATRPDGDSDVVATLRRAAGEAGGCGDHPAAHRFLHRALAEPPTPAVRPDLLAELALTEAAIGAPTALARLEEALLVLADPGRRAEVRHALARLQFARSDFTSATAAVESALDEVDPDTPLAARLRTDRTAITSVAATPAVDEALAQAGQDGRQLDGPELLARLAARRLRDGEPADRVRETALAALVGLAAAGHEDGLNGVATGYAVVTLLQIDALDEAEPPIVAMAARARETGSLIRLGFAHHWLAVLRRHQGRLDEAVAAAQQTLEVCRSGWDVCRGWVVPVLAHAHLDLGDAESAQAALRMVDDIGDDRPESPDVREAAGRLALERGDPETALRLMLAAGAAEEAHSPSSSPVLPWRSGAAIAAARLGRVEHAAALARDELDRARGSGAGRSLGVALRAAGLVTGGQDGIALLTESVAVLEGSPSVLERARALLDLGAARRRTGRSSEARAPLQRAIDLAEAAGAAALVAGARAELHAAGGRRRAARAHTGPAALTASEQRIAALAARGDTTPSIARSLYLSPKTVEWHLANAYRKLDIRSRHQLADVLGQPGAAGAAI
jgi:DNA-binding CsgD family transcriptional regulator